MTEKEREAKNVVVLQVGNGPQVLIRGKKTKKPVEEGLTKVTITGLEPGCRVAMFAGVPGKKTEVYNEQVDADRVVIPCRHRGTTTVKVRVRKKGIVPFEVDLAIGAERHSHIKAICEKDMFI